MIKLTPGEPHPSLIDKGEITSGTTLAALLYVLGEP